MFDGEGDWKERKHVYSKRRTWHKVILGAGREDRSGMHATDYALGASLTRADKPGCWAKLPQTSPSKDNGDNVRSTAIQRWPRATIQPRLGRANGRSRPERMSWARRRNGADRWHCARGLARMDDAHGKSAATITCVRYRNDDLTIGSPLPAVCLSHSPATPPARLPRFPRHR
jgi:hypothetical protein